MSNDEITLTRHQQEIFDDMVIAIKKGIDGDVNHAIVSLSGFAGSGKSTLLSKLIKHFDSYASCVCAPTHKACKVIRDFLGESAYWIDVRTIHSFLNLKLEPDLNTGLSMLKVDNYRRNENRVDILWCDESSMVSDELLSYCADKISDGSIKVVVLIGDQYQLLPVDDTKTSEFINDDNEFRLKEIIRQAEENPIIKCSAKIRGIIDSKQYLDYIGPELFDGLVVFENKKDFLAQYVKDKSDRILGTYTNSVTEKYNKLFRNVFMKNPIDSIVVGDELIFKKTLYRGKKVIHLNSDISKVTKCIKKKMPMHGVNYFSVTDSDFSEYDVLDFDCLPVWRKLLQEIADSANKASNNEDRRKLWGKYYKMQERFADVSYNYASTLHRLQGSTVDNIYLDLSDINNFYYNKDTVYRLLYVGITRARKEVFIFI